MSSSENKPSRQDRLRKVLSGLLVHMQNTASITIGGVAHAVTDLQVQIGADVALAPSSSSSSA